MKLNVRAFALACGVTWGGLIFILSWWYILFGDNGWSFLQIGQLTRGYSDTPMGSILALHWGFFDGLIAGLIFSNLYNFLITKAFMNENA